jgi:hypothetical protein
LEHTDKLSEVIQPVKMFLIKNYLKFEENKFTSASYMLEGDEKSVEWKDKELRKIAAKFGGYYVGEKIARHSYISSSTYSIYMRVSDFC